MQFKLSERKITFTYPFGNKKGEICEIKNPYIYETQGGFIVRTIHNSDSRSQYDYFVNGELVTQRCGASSELLELLIKHDVKAGEYEKFHQIKKEMRRNDL